MRHSRAENPSQWFMLCSRICAIALLVCISSTAFASDLRCASADRSFSAFLKRFQENSKFRIDRTVFPLTIESNTPGESGVESKQISAAAARGNKRDAQIPIPPKIEAMEALLTVDSPNLRSFDYRTTVSTETASIHIHNENEVLSSQQYDFAKKDGCWFLTKVSYSAHS